MADFVIGVGAIASVILLVASRMRAVKCRHGYCGSCDRCRKIKK